MEYEYKFKKTVIALILAIFLCSLIIIPSLIKDHKIISLIFLASTIPITLFHIYPFLFSMRKIVNDKGFKQVTTYYGHSKVKELRWDEIGYIIDDYIQPILFYPPYKLHIFHIMSKNNIKKPFKRISISAGIENYKDLLFKIVSHVGSDVVIDDYIYKFLERYKENLKKENRSGEFRGHNT